MPSELLGRYLSSASEQAAQAALAILFADFVQPWCREITHIALGKYALRSSERSEQTEETESEVLLQVTERLHSAREGRAEPISDLRAYIASCVYNTCFQRLRASSPERARLANSVRYLLRHDNRFSRWDSGRDVLAGLRRWNGQADHREPTAPEFPRRELAGLCIQIFELTGGPVSVGALVACLAETMGISKSRQVEFLDSSGSSRSSTLSSPTPGIDTTLERVQRLRRIWTEVIALPQNQRAALLLNLRDADGQGVIELIPATGIASIEDLAEILGMSPAAMEKLWQDLPLDDHRIGELLGLKRQQVINLRKSARDRMNRKISKPPDNISPLSASVAGEGMLRSAGKMVSRIFVRKSR